MTDSKTISRDRLAELLNEDLAREYQAIIAYVVYSQVLKGAEFMNIADQLEKHAQQELQHALIEDAHAISPSGFCASELVGTSSTIFSPL